MSSKDIEVFELTALEQVEQEEDLAGATGGWFYWHRVPGCRPDSDPIGPFKSAKAALEAAQEDAL